MGWGIAQENHTAVLQYTILKNWQNFLCITRTPRAQCFASFSNAGIFITTAASEKIATGVKKS